jgi:hypothetical protein
MSLEINYIDAPEGAQEKMEVSVENENVLTDSSLVARGARDIPYATLEPGIWKLDGTMQILPDDPNPGFWSAVRSSFDANGSELGSMILGEAILGASSTGGAFGTTPKITISFPVPYGSTGLTFTFSPSTDQWCSRIKVTWFNGQTRIIEKVYYPDSPRWTLEETFRQCNPFLGQPVLYPTG